MKSKWISKTTCYKYKDKTIIHTITNPEQQLLYFNGSEKPFEWDNGYIEISSPKPKFITRFKSRIKKLFKNQL
jgi:hypothetical protein